MKRIRKALAWILVMALLISTVPTQALAYLEEKESAVTIVDKNGGTITEDTSWEEAFPYGTFAFDNSQLIVDEGGSEGVIRLYRLGGTNGRAIAYVSYVPPTVEMADGSISHASAAGAEDVRIWVEDPLPIAEYQPLGKDPEPLEAETPATVIRTPYEGEDAQEGDIALTLDQPAESFQWQVLSDGSWQTIDGGRESRLVVDAGEYDFRCVYTVNGQRFGSFSLGGERYVREEEEPLPEMPENLEQNPDPTYSELPMDGENPYEGQLFSVVFADGEWVKELHVSAPEDDTAEPDKFGLFTIEDCLGGSLYDTANTLTLHVVDNDEAGESFLGFVQASLDVDKADGTAALTVRRTGDTTRVLTVDYRSEDGSAKSGADYTAVSGSLIFYAGVTEQTVEIPLIDDGKASGGRLDFSVTLSNVKGDGEGLCVLTADRAAVSLWNSGTGEGKNLATLLTDSGAEDISGSVTAAEAPVVPVDPDPVTGTQVTEEEAPLLEARIVRDGGAQGDIAPLTYDYPAHTLRFQRDNYQDYENTYWVDEVYMAGSDVSNTSYINNIGNSGLFGSWSGGNLPANGKLFSREYWGKSNGSITLPVTDRFFAEKFDSLYAQFDFSPEWASGWINFWYGGNEWTYPWFRLNCSNTSDYFDSGAYQSGNTIHYFPYRAKTFSTWSMADKVESLQLGTSENDAHASKDNALSRLKHGSLSRRSLCRDLDLRIYTANDEDTHGDAALISTELYGENGGMQPRVSLVPGQGGITWYGHLYVGSRLKVELKALDSYYPGASGVNYTVFLTDSSGNIKAQGSRESDKVYYLDLVWDNIELNDAYTVNVIMTRKQEVSLDITPSVTRQEDNPSAIDTAKIGESWKRFWESAADSGKNQISLGESSRSNSAPYLDSRTITVSTIRDCQDTGVEASLGKLENLQWINFGRSKEDYIVFNGRIYAGNETIWLEQKDLSRGKLNFLYYNSDYISSTSTMNVKLNGAGLYLDKNCNGRIDGWWNEELGVFQLEGNREDGGDEFLFRLDEDADYDETIFAPVAVEWDAGGNPIKYAQYFLKAEYSLTPRSLVPGPGVDVSREKAQVLPAFITGVTDTDNYSELTAEQQSYRYIISGMSRTRSKDGGLSEYSRSGDDRPMYGAEASQTAVIDIPLGGDTSPAALNADKSAYTWEPSYHGNLLYPFESPEPIFIANSVAGENIPVARIKSYQDGAVVYADSSDGRSGRDLLNGYLGSLTADDTYALCVQEQRMTTDGIAKANGVTIFQEAGNGGLAMQSDEPAERPVPESVGISGVKAMPNSAYLQQSSAGDSGEGNIDMADSGNEFQEFNMNLGVQLPSSNIGVTDFATIIMNGDQVGFSIGLPLGGYKSGKGGVSPAKALSNSKKQMSKMLDWINHPSQNIAGKDTVDGSYSDATKDTGKKLSSCGFSVNIRASVAFLFKYNSIDNTYYFSQFSASAAASLKFTAQYRFSPCPIVYVYITLGFSAEINTGATVKREVTLDGEKLADGAGKLKKGNTLVVGTDKKAFQLKFQGKVLVQTFTDEGCTQEYTGRGVQAGFLQSDGKSPVTVTLVRQDGQELGKTVYVRLTAMKDSSVTSFKPVTGAETKSYFSGFTFSPKLYVEAGAGIGISILKFEIYLKANVGCSMVFAQESAGGVDAFRFNSFQFGLGVGFRLVLLVFSYSMDLIQYNITYKNGAWKQSWSALGGLYGGDINTLSATDSQGNTYGVHISLPGSAADTQTIYPPEQEESGAMPMAIDPPDGKDVPFQLSGYGASADAFRLTDGLIAGYDYKAVAANGKNYLIYTISRTGAAHPVDNSMLVMSELRLTSPGGRDSYGLVNPVNADDPTPYVLLDTTDGSADDGTGDLEFTAWTDETGKIHAAWVSYAEAASGGAGDASEAIDSASKNTVIKTAGFDPDSGFSTPVILSGMNGGKPVVGAHVFLPGVVDSGTAVFGRAEHCTGSEVDALKADYKAYLKAIGSDPDSANEAEAQVGQYRLSYQEGLWDVYGKGTELCVSTGDTVSAVPLAEGQILDNLEAVQIAGTCYAAYTTTQKQYMKDGVSAASGSGADDLLTIRRLFLHTFTAAGDGTVTWAEKPLLLRTLYDYDVNAGENKDGVYTGGKIEDYDDPYFANLQFLSADLGALSGTEEEFAASNSGTAESFLLFEMNGSTYVVPQKDLESIASESRGSIIPFFTPSAVGGKTQSATGRAEVTIGADGAGGLAAVYVGTVPNSSSNAVYLTKYDPVSATWGAGTMLAANHMQVYEDASAYGLTAEQTEKAFLGKETGNEEYDAYIGGLTEEEKAHSQGAMDFLSFSNLQIALGQKKVQTGTAAAQEDPDSGLRSVAQPGYDSETSGRSAEAQPALTAEGTGDKDTLLVITQGSMRYLREIDNNGETVIGPMSDADAQSKYQGGGIPESRKPGVGVYAISYGAGQQAVGGASLTLASREFTAGASLSAGLSFQNTGDVALRAGKGADEQLTVKLMVGDTGNAAELAEWKITDHVLAGQEVSLSADCAPLTADLKEGAYFYFTVQEGGYFGSGAFSCQSGPLLTVGDRVELGFESLDVTTESVNESGSATLSVELDVSNRGSRAAEDVYLQFSYEDADGSYLPLDLTGNTLETARAEKLNGSRVMAMSAGTDLQNGIFHLMGPDGGGIEAGYHRQVSGTVTVPASCYADSLTGGLNLRVEVFSAGDAVTAMDAGILEAERDEYDTANNARTVSVPHATFFSSARRVSLAMGNTLRLPVTLSTTTGNSPSVAVVETPEQGESSHLGVLYYQNGSFSGGRETGALVMTPTGTGSGVVHLQDLNTNTIYAVAYTVTGEGDGVNIFNDTDLFAFRDYDPGAVGEDLPWKFNSGILSWGQGDGNAEPPMNGDLARGREGETFSFETQAESMKLYFDGEITVSSTFPGFGSASCTAEGGKNGFAEIKFGRNDTNYTHTVTVTVKKGAGQNNRYASFDRVVLSYGGGGTPVPVEDADAPRIYWSRSFPDTASAATGDSISLSAFVLDNSGLASVTVNGKNLESTEKTDGRFWTVPLTLTENGILKVVAADVSGHRTACEIEVDWFLDAPLEDASEKAPGLSGVDFEEKQANRLYEIIYYATPSENAGGAEPSLGITAITTGEDRLVETDHSGTAEVSANGWYYVKITDSAEGCTGQWSAEMLYMDQIDTYLPVVTIGRTDESSGEEDGADLEWHIKKDVSVSTTAATISRAALNGKPLDIPENQTWAAGAWHATHAGTYEVTAEDTAGNIGSGTFDLTDLPVYVEPGKSFYSVKNADNESSDNGSVTVEPNILLGGTYDAARSSPAAGAYEGSYEWRLVKDGSAPSLAAMLSEDDAWTEEQTVFDGLAPGGYTLYVRDANDRRNEKTVLTLSGVTVGSELIDVTLEEEIETFGGSSSGSDGLETSTSGTAQSRLLAWSAKKRAGAVNAITAVDINGQTVSGRTGFSLSDKFDIHFGGEYRLTANDDKGVSKSAGVTVEDFPITAKNNSALATLSHPWNAAADNGSITVNPTDENGSALVTGGLYDADVSDPANGSYAGSYEWRLAPAFAFDAQARLEELKARWLEEHSDVTEIPEEALADLEREAGNEEAAKAQWLSGLLNTDDGWRKLAEGTNKLDGQKAGDHTLLIRDAQDKANPKTVLTLPVVFQSEYISLTAEASPARGGKNDGSVRAEAGRGYRNLNTYQFILRPIKSKKEALADPQKMADPLDREIFPEAVYRQPKWDIPDFSQLDDPDEITDTSYDLLNSTAFQNLPSGWYQVAARPMLDVDSGELLELARLAAACNADKGSEDARAAYETRYEELMGRAAAAYEDPDKGAIGWGNANTVTIHVDHGETVPSQIEVSDLGYLEDGTVTVTFSSGKPTLSAAAERRLVFDNAACDILASGPAMEAVIPAGTLSLGDSVAPMLIPFAVLPGNTAGTVVRYTDKEGADHYVPWSVVTGGKAYYIAARPGTYEVVTNPVEFSDVDGTFWGVESIGFTTARELFQGVGEKRFAPNGTMTRGMLVTVLARLDGVDQAACSGRVFTDVDPNAWYGPAVAWAAENGIVNGVGGNRFEPEKPATREQLCTILARYFDYAGLALSELADPVVFRDQDQVSGWAKDAVEQCRKTGIVKGDGAGRLQPWKNATRAELATVFTNLITEALVR